MLIGREKEIKTLQQAYHSEYSEFVAVYGDDASGRLSLSERLSTISLPFSILVCIKKHSRNNFATSEMP